MKISRLIFALVVTVLSGCASFGDAELACPGSESGVTCMPATEVYELTNDPERAKSVREENRINKLISDGKLDPDNVKTNIIKYDAVPTKLADRMIPLSQPKPVLKPAEVIRIWISPWIDEKQDLHMPSYVFSEVTPRRWNFGLNEVKGSRVMTPFTKE